MPARRFIPRVIYEIDWTTDKKDRPSFFVFTTAKIPAISQCGHVTVKPVGIVVVEAVVGERLVDRKADVVEASYLRQE